MWVLGAAAAGAVYATALLLVLLWPGAYPLPDPVWIAAFVGVFPVFGSAVVVANRYWRGGVWTGPVALPARPTRSVLIYLLAVVAVVLWLAMAAMFLFPPDPLAAGQPTIVDGRYVANNHGDLTPLTRAQYLRGREQGQRLFLQGALLFHVVTALIAVWTADHQATEWDRHWFVSKLSRRRRSGVVR